MKRSKVVVFIAMLLCMAMIAAVPVFAKDHNSNGSAGFGGKEAVKPVDPEDPKDPLDPNNPGTGDDSIVSIDYVPAIKFGTGLKVNNNDNGVVEKHESKISSMTTGVGGKYDAPFVQVTDSRPAAKAGNWEVSVKCADFVVKSGTNKDAKLEGAEILFNPGGATNSTITTTTNRAVVNTSQQTAKAGVANSKAVVMSADAGVYGTWVGQLYDRNAVIYDYAANPTTPYKNAVIELSEAPYSAIAGESYEATLTWSLTLG